MNNVLWTAGTFFVLEGNETLFVVHSINKISDKSFNVNCLVVDSYAHDNNTWLEDTTVETPTYTLSYELDEMQFLELSTHFRRKEYDKMMLDYSDCYSESYPGWFITASLDFLEKIFDCREETGRVLKEIFKTYTEDKKNNEILQKQDKPIQEK